MDVQSFPVKIIVFVLYCIFLLIVFVYSSEPTNAVFGVRGYTGCGKSAYLNYAAHFARQNGWYGNPFTTYIRISTIVIQTGTTSLLDICIICLHTLHLSIPHLLILICF